MTRAGQLPDSELLRLPDREAMEQIVTQETTAFPEQDIPELEEILFQDEIESRDWAFMEFPIDRIIPAALLSEDFRLPGETSEEAMFARRRARIDIRHTGGLDALLEQSPVILVIENGFVRPLAGAHLCAIAALEHGAETVRAAVGYDRELGFRLREMMAMDHKWPAAAPEALPEPG